MAGMSNRNPALLPDVAGDAVALARPLDWVGMEHIALPVRIADGAGGQLQVAADIDVAVNLADAGARGIHMSRLYLQLQDGLAREAITPAGLRHLLQDGIASQQGLATQARLRIRYEALLQRAALESGFAGWKRYPVEIEATLGDGHLKLALAFELEYSSTCPLATNWGTMEGEYTLRRGHAASTAGAIGLDETPPEAGAFKAHPMLRPFPPSTKISSA